LRSYQRFQVNLGAGVDAADGGKDLSRKVRETLRLMTALQIVVFNAIIIGALLGCCGASQAETA
jgi:hypothetical protein